MFLTTIIRQTFLVTADHVSLKVKIHFSFDVNQIKIKKKNWACCVS